MAGAIFAIACLIAPAASAKPTQKIPASAQGHAYRHGVVPRRGHQLASAPSTSSSTGSTSSANLMFGGAVNGVGVTTGSPKVYVVFWGSQWGSQGSNSQGDVTLTGDPQRMAPYLQRFLKGLGTSGETWSGVMTQYCQGVRTGAQTCPSSNTQHVGYPTGGALAGVWVDESSAAPQQATGDQIGAEAVSAAAHFGNTTTTANRNAQYVIVSPTGTNPDGFNTPGVMFCGWHDYTGDNLLSGGAVTSPYGPLAFTNLPYIPDAGQACGENFVNAGSAGALDGVSIIEGHEYAETLTDQFPSSGWTDQSGNETADNCAWISSGQGASADVSLATGRFAVQSTWANDFNNGSGGCEISHPLVTNNDITVDNPGAQTSTANQAVALQISSNHPSAEYTAAGLPVGLSISTSGLISGTPVRPGTSTVTVFAFDPAGPSGSTSFSWTVGNSTTTVVSCAPGSLTGGTQTTCTATVSDPSGGSGTTPIGTVTFGAGEGYFSSGTCTLTPTPSAGTASCTTTYTPTAAGSPTVDATYPGDDLHTGSAGSASLTVTAQTNSSGNDGSGSSGSQSPGGGSPPPTNTTQGGSPATRSGSTTTTTPAPTPPARVAGPACPAATGRLGGSTLGLVGLGMTRRQVRSAYRRSSLRSLRYQDIFCLTPTGLTVGYPSQALMRALTASQRKQLGGRAVWATTANPRYLAGSIRPGARLAAARRALGTANRVVIGRVVWYFLPQRSATVVVEVRSGVVREVGIASRELTRTARAEALLARSLA